MESIVFTQCVRAQVTTSQHKPCTYFAVYEGRNVFVKGPFPSRLEAEMAVYAQDMKKRMMPDLPTIHMDVVALEVDVAITPDVACEIEIRDKETKKKTKIASIKDVGFLGFQTGLRSRWIHGNMRGKPGYFLVTDDLVRMSGGVLCTKQHSTPTMWPVPVTVVDWKEIEALCDFRHGWYSSTYKDSMFGTQKLALQHQIQFVMHLLLAWACGCGNDWAMSNFILLDSGVYQVDLDIFGDFSDKDLYKSTALRTEAARKNFKQFCETYAEPIKAKLTVARNALALDSFLEMKIRTRLDSLFTLLF